MPDDPYTLSDLARLADVTPRTVRYYVHQGLLPSPEAAGPATRYGEGHLLRLRLIRRLQRDHLPLAEIRSRLERLDDAAVEAALDAVDDTPPAPSMSTDETLAFVRQLMSKAGVSPRFYETPEPPARGSFERDVPDGFPVREPPVPSGPAPSPDQPSPSLPSLPSLPSPAPGRSPAPMPALPSVAPQRVTVPLRLRASEPRPGADRSTWERLAITPDVEIHVRRPLDRLSNKRVDQLARIARELFEDEA